MTEDMGPNPAFFNKPVTEQELISKSVAPRVTQADIERLIVTELYGNAGDLQVYEDGKASIRILSTEQYEAITLLTICVLVLRNGFTVLGQSACASPENYNADIGRRLARQDAFNKIWQLEGYLLKTRLATNEIGG